MSAAVLAVAQKRHPTRGELNADLVGASRHKSHQHKRTPVLKDLKSGVAQDGSFATLASSLHDKRLVLPLIVK